MLRVSRLKRMFSEGTVNEGVVLNDPPLMLPDGDSVATVGLDGAGGFTFLNAIAGGFYADDGEIFLDSLNITFMSEHERSRIIGRLLQDPLPGTVSHITIEKNLTIAYLRASGHTSAFSRSAAKGRIFFWERLSEPHMDLEDRTEQPTGLLFDGQRQVLMSLMATVVTSKLLLPDEYMAALDPKMTEKVLDLAARIVWERHISCPIVTHNMHQVLALGSHTLMTDGGCIVFDVPGETKVAMTVQGLFD